MQTRGIRAAKPVKNLPASAGREVNTSDSDGWVTYYIVPVEHADDIVDVDDLFDKEAEGVMEEVFRDPVSFAEWARENPEVEMSSYWETREI